MLVVASDEHRAHHGLELTGGAVVPSTESPDRADLIERALRADGHEFSPPEPFDHDLVARVHTPQYLQFLSTAWDRWCEREGAGPAAMGFTWPARQPNVRRPADIVGQLGYHSFAADCSIGPGTWQAASTGAALAMTAADRMVERDESTFALCRPPGHHATPDQFGGYCYLNNAAVAAERLRNGGAERVAVLDVDYHHGNGTQAIFYERSDVLFASLHADPVFEFPWFAGHADEVGAGAGEGRTLNVPLERGTDLAPYLAALSPVLEAIVEFGADALVVSLGVDIYRDDPLGTFDISTAGFGTIASRIAGMGLPAVIVQEGGYATADIGANVGAFLAGFQ